MIKWEKKSGDSFKNFDIIYFKLPATKVIFNPQNVYCSSICEVWQVCWHVYKLKQEALAKCISTRSEVTKQHVRQSSQFDRHRYVISLWCAVCVCILVYVYKGSSHFTQFRFARFRLKRFENLHHFSYLRHNFWFNAIWHRRSAVALIFCRKLAGCDVTVTPSVTCMEWLRWWYNHTVNLASSATALAFLPIWVTNVHLHHLVQSKGKIGERQLVLKINYT